MKIELTVAYVGFGGNIGDGEYFYSFRPDVILVTEVNTPLDFVFHSATTKDFSMLEMVSTDTSKQMGKATKAADGRSLIVNDANSLTQLTQLAIIVKDNSRGKIISCDPQVLNIPDIS